MNSRAIIFGIRGYKLRKDEKNLFKRIKPWGIILFSRNIKNIKQLKNLIFDIKKTFKQENYPILIDQEGGKVSRINSIFDFKMFSQSFFGKIYNVDKKKFMKYYKIYIDSVSSILKEAGININTVPVLDVRRKITHKIIGSRSFSNNTTTVKKLGNTCINYYQKNSIATVMKHIPGHGLSRLDSHYKTPLIKASKKELKKDFIPFKKSKSNFAMTAHVIYQKYDNKNTATHSKIIIKNIIRKYMHFRGILISDDISMKALKYNIEKNALKALDAGCNLVLHCNANIKEMYRLAKVIPNIDKFTKKKTSHFYKFLR
tara:strand:+ start:7210 stop:8154 length:945 start_codon:yes stop_codon:yes gene_type:complete